MATNRLLLLLLIALLALAGCTSAASSAAADVRVPSARPITVATPQPAAPAQPSPTPEPTGPAPVYGYRVVASYPHDPNAFTQGLVYIGDDRFYEGTGLYGQSTLREVNLTDGTIVPGRLVRLRDEFFGEGVALVDGRIFQLTWKECTGLIYDAASFTQIGTFRYGEADGVCLPTQEGWGLAYDGERLIMSDGTATLTFLDPVELAAGRFTVLGTVDVHDNGTPITNLNELEVIDGLVYANVWLTDRIVKIDPATGCVLAWIDLTGLLPSNAAARVDVLNGIAYDAEQKRLFVTGKWWPTLFEIELLPPPLNLSLINTG
jgi:glutamine cyclotransferase